MDPIIFIQYHQEPFRSIQSLWMHMDPKGSIWICISGPHAGPLLYIPYHPGNISQYKRRLKNPNVIHKVPMDPFGSLWIQMDQYTAIYIPYCTCVLYWQCVSSNIYIHLNFQMQIHINPNGSVNLALLAILAMFTP